MENIFTYGSLMFDQVWSRVITGQYRKKHAVLTGYDRKELRGEVYPAVYPSGVHSQVPGIVYFEVSAADLVKLDIFEGEYYFRKSELVITMEGESVPAEVYVLKEEYYPVIAHNRDWDAARFEKNGLHRFLDNYFGFSRKDSKIH